MGTVHPLLDNQWTASSEAGRLAEEENDAISSNGRQALGRETQERSLGVRPRNNAGIQSCNL